MSLRNLLWAIEQRHLSPTRKVVLLDLAERCGESRHCWPYVEEIAARCNITGRTVQTTIAELEAAGLIAVERRPRQTTVYYLEIPEEFAPLKGQSQSRKNLHQKTATCSPENDDTLSGNPRQVLRKSTTVSPEIHDIPYIVNHQYPSKEPPRNHQVPPNGRARDAEHDNSQDLNFSTGDKQPHLGSQGTQHRLPGIETRQPPSVPAAAAPPSAPRERRTAARGGDDAAFAAFWSLYPRKEAKGRALTAWGTAMRKVGADQIMAALAAYRFSDEPRFIPHPATWLNDEHWHDQPTTAARQRRPSAPTTASERRDANALGCLALLHNGIAPTPPEANPYQPDESFAGTTLEGTCDHV
ncbi:helix-turn-helix domain-containing protein [Rhodopila globiformis]|uniref:Helix-turn-helix domain-containing protein n=1 Tax=Rhodopila globiformis TaxID=1071 RepID=A0A2S6N7J2_RHOGL|nr:helix-turn-helix domain-containing protein [Rhodopila globiformis]PPQ30576.1 hypothetical protein CCS01_18870 [Rhodopila globiformis]